MDLGLKQKSPKGGTEKLLKNMIKIFKEGNM